MSGFVHPLFGPQGLRGGEMETFGELSDWRMPVGRRVLVRVSPGSVRSPGLMAATGLGRRVPAPMHSGGLTVRELHAVTGTPVSTLRRQLARLARDRLAFKDSDGLWWRYHFDPDWLAHDLHIPDTAKIKSAQYLNQRRGYFESRADLEPDRRGAVIKIDEGDVIHYINEVTGEVQWTDRLGSGGS